jgi:uncharacterized membrane protein YgcG
LCCLRYEHDIYDTSRKRFPKEGKEIRTARGAEKVLAVDIFRDRVMLRAEDGTVRTLLLADLKMETGDGGGATAPIVERPLPPPAAPAARSAPAGASRPETAPQDPGAPRSKRRRRRHGRRRKGRGDGGGGSSGGGGAPPEGSGGQ